MRYRVTCLTPTLVGDGQKLSPIDYMVWKDHVNVLDQRRIFRLLAKGPRLDGYLAQLKKAEKLDFASWGGFAQNFAGRRIPFEHTSAIPFWEKARAENLFIPTFAMSPAGPYVPGTALKGALRTGVVFDRWTESTMRDLAGRLEQEDRIPRNLAGRAEDAALGGSGNNRMRRVSTGDSTPINHSSMKVYLLRVTTLVARGADKFELGWKSPRGSVDSRRIEESTPIFAEMASPGTSFEGAWQERSVSDRARIFQASNRYAADLINRHKQYAASCGLSRLGARLTELEARLAELSSRQDACLLSIGWGGGLLGKSAYLDTQDESYRKILKQVSTYQRVLQTGLPFPKTRRVIFEEGHPASLPGWILLQLH
ncbi:MAG TPA: type III-A CRISPR-associated RAMP protein Csm5 [Bryobacteraceae bacterium]|nr:type III-A CRISPR-associated RAMP protein Csm5 [Bryobacteraceae bacterium]